MQMVGAHQLFNTTAYLSTSLRSVPDFLILLPLTPDDFTRQEKASRNGKSEDFNLAQTNAVIPN